MRQLAISIDQAINTLVYIPGDGFGMADETISARIFRCYLHGLIGEAWYLAVDALFFWQDRHCYMSWRNEIERKQLPGFYS